jgi:hypothetical protein
MLFLARLLQLLGLIVTGLAFFDGVIGGNVRREIVLLGVGGVLFLAGRFLQGRGR